MILSRGDGVWSGGGWWPPIFQREVVSNFSRGVLQFFGGVISNFSGGGALQFWGGVLSNFSGGGIQFF